MSEPRDFEEEIAALRDRMNRLLSNFSREVEQPEMMDEVEWAPPLDVLEDKDDIVIKVDIPGMAPDAIDLSIAGDVLRIRGERKREDKNYHTIERGYGRFDRRVTLPTSVKADSIRAFCRDGVLTVKLPKLEEKRIGEIKVSLE
jgi:HSP20 family protein